MAEPASYIGGVVALWKTCVLVYDIIDSSCDYGIDYERLAGKFELERVRLLCWGDAVGIPVTQAQGYDSLPGLMQCNSTSNFNGKRYG